MLWPCHIKVAGQSPIPSGATGYFLRCSSRQRLSASSRSRRRVSSSTGGSSVSVSLVSVTTSQSRGHVSLGLVDGRQLCLSQSRQCDDESVSWSSQSRSCRRAAVQVPRYQLPVTRPAPPSCACLDVDLARSSSLRHTHKISHQYARAELYQFHFRFVFSRMFNLFSGFSLCY